MTSFVLVGTLEQICQAPTMKIKDLIHRAPIDKGLDGLEKGEARNAGGPTPYSPLSFVKLTLLGQ